MIETTKEGEDVEARGWQHAFGQLRICEILFFPLPHSIFYTKSIRSHRQSQRGRERLPPQQSDQYIFVSLYLSLSLFVFFTPVAAPVSVSVPVPVPLRSMAFGCGSTGRQGQ